MKIALIGLALFIQIQSAVLAETRCATYGSERSLERAFTEAGAYFQTDIQNLKFNVSQASGFFILKMIGTSSKIYLLLSDEATSICKIQGKENYLSLLKYGRQHHPFNAQLIYHLQEKQSGKSNTFFLNYVYKNEEFGYIGVNSILLSLNPTTENKIMGSYTLSKEIHNPKKLLQRKQVFQHSALMRVGGGELLKYEDHSLQRKGSKYFSSSSSIEGDPKEVTIIGIPVSSIDFYIAQILQERDFPQKEPVQIRTIHENDKGEIKVELQTIEFSYNSYSILVKNSENRPIKEIKLSKEFRLEYINLLGKKLILKSPEAFN